MSKLFTNLKIGENLLFKNRICLSPMSMYSAEDGFINDFHLVHYGRHVLGGSGLIMFEATAVSEDGRGSFKDAGIYRDEHIAQLRKVTDFVHSQNGIIGIELFHSGRKGSTEVMWIDKARPLRKEEGAWDCLAPSPIAYDNMPIPKEATLKDIELLKCSFKESARRAYEAGFDIINLHVGYGYLLNTFLSPYTNKRTDRYGGCFENRTRIVMEILTEMKTVLPKDFPLMIRLSVVDALPEEEGWSLNDTIAFVKVLQTDTNVVLIDLVYGANVEHDKSVPELIVTPFDAAEAIRKECTIPLSVNGGIVNTKWADKIVTSGLADMVVIGRASLNNPNWPMHAAFELGAEHTLPVQYGWTIGVGSWRSQIKLNNNQTELEPFQEKNS